MKEPNKIPSNFNRGALPEARKALGNIRRKNISRLIFNINSLWNKFESQQHIINKNIDVLLNLKQKLIFLLLHSTISFKGLCNPIQIGQKWKCWWHPAVYKRRYFFKVTKY